MSQGYEKLKRLLMELFQLDQPDLDFGFYRIMHVKSAEVTQFLEHDLLPQVKAAFALYQPADKAAIEKELTKAIEQAQALGAEPETLPKVKELRARLAHEAVDLDALEAEVYDHLYSFFRRYYSEGDFLSKRVYKPGIYAIPYEGEEVKLHWANADQYYIKTSEYLRDYAFRLRPEDAKNPMRVHFRLADAAEGEHSNVKERAGKERRFKLAEPDAMSVENNELLIRFTYQPDAKKQKELNAAAETAVLATATPAFAEWLNALGEKHVRADGTQSEATRLRVHVDRYTGRNTFDYFIHKDLGGFLRRELDFYIKNEVMHLDDVESESAPRVEQYLSKIKVMRRIAGKIIEFLAQLEDFQKKLWLKKKFAVATSYLISLDRVPEELYATIALNEAQRERWVRLFSIDGLDDYTKPLTVEFLKQHNDLILDSSLFDEAFEANVVAAQPDHDSLHTGVLVHADNFHALRLAQQRFKREVKSIYIDPPYNTHSSAIPYKNDYKHSSFATMMRDRLAACHPLLSKDGAIFVSIDKTERTILEHALDESFGADNHIEELIWTQATANSQLPNYSTNHEYVEVYARSRGAVEADKAMFREPKPGFADVMELVARLEPGYPPLSEVETALSSLFDEHTLATRDASDIVQILRFLKAYVTDRVDSIERIRRVLHDGLVTATGRNLFTGRFTYLNMCGLTPEQIFDETLGTLFNAPGGGTLHVENLKGVTGEVAIRVGENDPFGVINVGDDAKLVRLCEEKGLDAGEREFVGSLFHELEQPHSKINVLIGSKKFTEGWSSWRVSTMGLMNVGRGEGAQIIQLFGRGVRLKGYGMSLKRSARATLPEGLERPQHIDTLETLHIFGIRADYMAQFRDFLEEEGLPPNIERVELILPVIKSLGTRPLKTIRLKKAIDGVSTESGDAFRKLGPIPTVQPPNPMLEPRTDYLQKNQVVLNWYPKIQAMKSAGVAGGDDDGVPNQAHLTPRHIAFLELDRLYFELERFKGERGWHNLNLTQAGIAALLADITWYRLLIPESELAFDSFDKVRVWQEVASALLRKYTERYYTFRKREWELPHLEYRDVAADDPNFPVIGRETSPEYGYRILIEESQQEIVQKLKELKAAIEVGDLKEFDFRGLKTIWFERHLYQPLVYLDSGVVEISPAPLNKGEWRFVEDLKAFHEANPKFFADKELYLLRNLSRGRGVGFFEAGNFHPDFIVWQLLLDRQQIAFVDPKGIRNVGLQDPKISFYETVKEIEQRLGDPKVELDSFIVSNTASHVMRKQWGIEKPEMVRRHVLFQEEDKDSYIGAILGA